MVGRGILVLRGRTKRKNASSKIVEDIANVLQQIMRRVHAFELAQQRGRITMKAIKKCYEYEEEDVQQH